MVGSRLGEQRRHQRVPFDGAVRVNGVFGQGIDVSVGGLRVKSVYPAPEVGSIVVIECSLPGAGPVATRAAVHRVEDGGVYVLRFVRLDPMTMMTLVRFASAETEAA